MVKYKKPHSIGAFLLSSYSSVNGARGLLVDFSRQNTSPNLLEEMMAHHEYVEQWRYLRTQTAGATDDRRIFN